MKGVKIMRSHDGHTFPRSDLSGRTGFAISSKLLLVLILVSATVVAQNLPGYKTKLEEGIASYKSANYDKAITLLSGLASDKSVTKGDQREIWLYLGRSYLAKSLNDKAREAISNMLELEPPIIELDPDAECPPLMKIYYDVRKKMTGSTKIELPDPGIKTIAILDFKNRSIDDKEKFDPMEKGFAELLINQLNGAVSLKVIERERIQWILDEIGLENDPGKFDPESAVRVGKQLGVHTILIGNFIKARDELYLGARLVKVETSEILMTDQIKGDADDFFELTENLSAKVAKGINVAISQAELEKGTETKSLDAMMAYSEGLVFLERGNYKMAFDKFQQALSIDPKYDKARLKADSLRPLLG
jgi:TolB-like protein